MEWITGEIIGAVIGFSILYLIIHLVAKREEKKKAELRKSDTNIEWYGPDIHLKRKDYSKVTDDFKDKILTDTEVQKEKEFKRIQNIKVKD